MPSRIPLIDRISFAANGCWVCSGSNNGKYQVMYFRGRQRYVHRVVAYLFLGMSLDDPLQVLHRCDNTSCCNPKHLFIGTQAENIEDCIRKGRHFWRNRTHCKYGHELSGANVYLSAGVNGRTTRKCKPCTLISNAEIRKRTPKSFPRPK